MKICVSVYTDLPSKTRQANVWETKCWESYQNKNVAWQTQGAWYLLSKQTRCMWCTSSTMMYIQCYDVHPVLWCTSSAMMYIQYYDVHPVLWCTSSAIMYIQCYDVHPVLWCTSSADVYCVLPVTSITHRYLIYTR